MYASINQALAAERVRDMQASAAAARLARQARGARHRLPAWAARPAAQSAAAQPDWPSAGYAQFLAATSAPACREPAAADWAAGQRVC